MDTDSRELFFDTVARFLADRYGAAARSAIRASEEGWSSSIWSEMASLGLLAAPWPEANGGLGDPEILVPLMERFGHVLLLEPYVSTVVVGGTLFAELHRSEALAAIAGGGMRLALAHDERPSAEGEICTKLVSTAHGLLLSGRKIVVRDAPAATHFLVSAKHSGGAAGISLLLLPAEAPGIACQRYRLIDGASAADLTFDRVPVPPAAVLDANGGEADLLRRLLDQATLAVCGEAIGVLRSMLQQTVEYARQRQQFGRPILSFQVLQHRLVDMLVEIEQAESLALRAAHLQGEPAAVSAAKIRVNQALRSVSQASIQLHGGIGTTDELALGQYFRRAAAIERQYGSAAQHYRRIEPPLLNRVLHCQDRTLREAS